MWTWLILIGLATVLLWAVVLYWHCMTTGSALKPALDPSTMLVHTPRTSKSLGSSAGVCSIQGRRRYMEDSFHAEVDLVGDDRGSAFFGVYDGHGGAKASQFAADRVHKLLLERDFRASPAVALMEAILQTDVDWLEMANQYNCDDGSTLITLFVHGGRMYVGNVGDSRAVLVSDDKAIAMSDDHKPSRQDERNRIEKLGGSVIFHGTWRVCGVLSLSRAIGDRGLKRYICAEPDITQRTLCSTDQYMILASDGVWDVLSNEEAAAIALRADDAKAAADAITEAAYTRGSSDNITTLVVDMNFYYQKWKP